jgi:hypothetical protein
VASWFPRRCAVACSPYEPTSQHEGPPDDKLRDMRVFAAGPGCRFALIRVTLASGLHPTSDV